MTNENHEKVPNFESIEIDDVEDLIQLSNFYKTNTPKEKFLFGFLLLHLGATHVIAMLEQKFQIRVPSELDQKFGIQRIIMIH